MTQARANRWNAQHGQARVLSMVASGEPLPRILQALSSHAEEVLTGTAIAVVLLNGNRLDPVAPGRLDQRCREGLNGFQIYPTRGPLAEAIAFGERYRSEANEGAAPAKGDELQRAQSTNLGETVSGQTGVRFTGFHTLSQEMIELIVRVRESASDIAYTVESSDQVTRQ